MLFLLLVGILLYGGDTQQICNRTSPMDDADRNFIVELHNTYRAYVARGEGYKLGGRLPGSTGIFELNYDCDLEHMAENNTYACNQTSLFPNTSINYFTLVNEPYVWSKHEVMTLAVSQWYQPVLNFDTSSENNPDDIAMTSDPRMESFANMMYYKALRIGCSHSLCPATATTPSINAIACLYRPEPQQNERIYPAGSYGCVDDADCWEYGTPISRCINEGPYRGLCSEGKNVTVETTTVPASKTSTATWSSSTESVSTSSPSPTPSLSSPSPSSTVSPSTPLPSTPSPSTPPPSTPSPSTPSPSTVSTSTPSPSSTGSPSSTESSSSTESPSTPPPSTPSTSSTGSPSSTESSSSIGPPSTPPPSTLSTSSTALPSSTDSPSIPSTSAASPSSTESPSTSPPSTTSSSTQAPSSTESPSTSSSSAPPPSSTSSPWIAYLWDRIAISPRWRLFHKNS